MNPIIKKNSPKRYDIKFCRKIPSQMRQKDIHPKMIPRLSLRLSGRKKLDNTKRTANIKKPALFPNVCETVRAARKIPAPTIIACRIRVDRKSKFVNNKRVARNIEVRGLRWFQASR
jgi:hypothetical protein